jgi:hypothetical protein
MAGDNESVKQFLTRQLKGAIECGIAMGVLLGGVYVCSKVLDTHSATNNAIIRELVGTLTNEQKVQVLQNLLKKGLIFLPNSL